MTSSVKGFHSSYPHLLISTHVVLVDPQTPGNVGAAVRAMANMGIAAPLRIVGSSSTEIIKGPAITMARHAAGSLNRALFFDTLSAALDRANHPRALAIAMTGRLGSAKRPHPLWVHEALPNALSKLVRNECSSVFLVFGPESDGLSNEDVCLCDWIVGIPSDERYRSLNLAQAVMVCCYELRRSSLVESERPPISVKRTAGRSTGQKERFIVHLLEVAESAGFILPGDPMKMRPRLEQIFAGLPNHVKNIKTLHGLLDQVVRSIRRGEPDIRGRYRRQMEQRIG